MEDPAPRECQVGYKFKAEGADFKILEARYPSTDDNSYDVSAGNATFSCDLFDHGGWYAHDPLDFKSELSCPGGPTGEQKRAACCVIHGSCQYLSHGAEIPEACKKGHAFEALGVPFKIADAEYPSTDANSYTLAGDTGAPFDCDCFDHGDWYCSDPTFRQDVLTCASAAAAAPEASAKEVPVLV